jgi:putative tricarboxylic transport membrane protein
VDPIATVGQSRADPTTQPDEVSMTDTTHAGTSGPSHRKVEIGVAVTMIGFAAIVITGSLKVGIGWGAEGPKAGFFPFYIGVSIILASILNIGLLLSAPDRGKVFADRAQLMSVLSIVAPTAVYVVAVPFVGIYVSSIILITAFMMWLGRYNVAFAAAVAVGVMVSIYLMFEKWFLVPLPKGPLEDWLGL